MAEQDLDRSEAATPFKLQKAHERGQVARSMDVVSATVFAAASVFLAWQGWDGVMGVTRMFGVALSHAESAGSHMGGTALWQLVGDLAIASAGALSPFMLTLMAAAVIGNLVQTGPVWSMEPLKADLDRINPASGFKRLFTMRTLFDAARACLKLAVLLAAAWLALKSLLPQFFALAHMDTLAFFRTLVSDCADLALKMAAVLALIAAADWGYTRREFGQKMRMSRRELKDEYKNREGDPRIRSRLRDLRRELLKRSLALRNTGSADVVLTNPTHYAVALRYVHGEMEAPQMVAKGAGQLAAAMRELAYRRRIPVVQNPLLTRKLFRGMDIEDIVPRDFHAEVARIIVWVFAMRENRKAAAQGARV